MVTTEQSTPLLYTRTNGEFVVTDLIGAGIPFDVATYGRFVAMPLTGYDVIVLNGHTSPVSVADVAAKCQAAIASGRKVFINGQLPFQRYDTSGALVETNKFGLTLFGAMDGGYRRVTGSAVLPSAIEKDPRITSVVLNASMNTFSFAASPPVTVTVGGRIIGFLCPTGGAIDGMNENVLNLLDYGKVVNYLRNGDSTIAGFANDRITGKPIVSFEVHCDHTSNLRAIDAIDALTREFGVPLVNLLVYDKLSEAAIDKWNSLTNPLMTIGSHSRSHPQDWTLVPDALYETTQALADQRVLIPATGGYLNFSGDMNPTTAQIGQMYAAGLRFGAGGSDFRQYRLATGEYIDVQRLPTRRIWLMNLAKSTSVPFFPSQTLDSDYATWKRNQNFCTMITSQFEQNVRCGMYSYTYIHDYFIDPQGGHDIGGVSGAVQIRCAMEYLRGQDVAFTPTDELVARLQDYIAGNVTSSTNPDGSMTLTVTRPNSVANEIKIGWKNGRAPVASGASVVSQYLVGQCLYVTLRPEVTSTVQVRWVIAPPAAPVVQTDQPFVSDTSVIEWEEPINPSLIAEYQYAVGTSSGGRDLRDWTSTGTARTTTLADVGLAQGMTCYVSVRARYADSGWGEDGVSRPFVVDLTPPSCSVTDDGETQVGNDYLNARWTITDPESGVYEAQYAVGTAPGLADYVDWMPVVGNDLHLTDLVLMMGETYYVSVRVRNGAGASVETSSDGILIALPKTIGLALNYSDGVGFALDHVVVTAAFPPAFYIQDAQRAAGIKAYDLPPTLKEGDELMITGRLSTTSDDGRVLIAQACTVTGTAVVKPLGMLNRDLAGGVRGLSVPGATGASGLNNTGLLVTTFGKVTEIGDGYVRVDDGSMSRRDDTSHSVKVRVSTVPDELRVGSFVIATGISALDRSGPNFKRMVITRKPSDLVILNPQP